LHASAFYLNLALPCCWKNGRVQQQLQNTAHAHHQTASPCGFVPVDVHLTEDKNRPLQTEAAKLLN
jgi:hypothetical protein